MKTVASCTLAGRARRLSLRDRLGLKPVRRDPGVVRCLRCGPLEAESVAVRIGERQLLHAVRRDFRLSQIDALFTQLFVCGVQVFAAEKQAGISVAGNPRRIGHRGAPIFLVRGIEHDLGAIQPEPGPTTIVPRIRGGPDFESQHIAVETNCRGHVENLQQGRDAVNVHNVYDPPFGGKIYQKTAVADGSTRPRSLDMQWRFRFDFVRE